jgi:hypothetical protein
VQSAFQLDSLRASHPIEVPVKNALEVDQIFDHISYLKGSSVIRMLSSHLGQETFLRGVANYLKAHAYGIIFSRPTPPLVKRQRSNDFFKAMRRQTISGPLSARRLAKM